MASLADRGSLLLPLSLLRRHAALPLSRLQIEGLLTLQSEVEHLDQL